MSSEEKRSVSVTVKMAPSDFKLLTRAAERLWPGAILSNSNLVLGLAKLAAQRILERRSDSKSQ